MTRANARWAVSFADMCLLLVGFLIIVQAAPDRRALAAGVRTAFHGPAPVTLAAPPLFERGEAVLAPRGRQVVADLARRAGTAPLMIASIGVDASTSRLDGWELAAARTTALARALVAAGVPEGHVHLRIGRTEDRGQRLTITFG